MMDATDVEAPPDAEPAAAAAVHPNKKESCCTPLYYTCFYCCWILAYLFLFVCWSVCNFLF